MAVLNRSRLDGIYTQFDRTFNDAFNQLYGSVEGYKPFTTETNSNTDTVDYKWMSELPQLEEWIGERTIRSIGAHTYPVQNKKWSSAVSISREDLEDDTLGIALQRIMNLADQANRGVAREVFQKLKAGQVDTGIDGLAFFSNHGAAGTNLDTGGSGNFWYLMDTTKMSYKPMILQWRDKPQLDQLTRPDSDHVFKLDEFLYGVRARFVAAYGFWQTCYASDQALNGTYLEAAAEAMMAFKDANGEPLGIMPDTLVVHPGNWAEANRLFKADLISDGTNYVSNIHKGAFKVIVSEWLQD